MYQNRHGRFTAPDPLLASASLDNPQTFNRYVYVGNNPVNLTDPSGLDWCRNKESGVGTFREGTGTCTSEETDITGSNREIVGGSIVTDNGYEANVGEVVRLNANGSATYIGAGQQQANQVGVQVQATSDPIASTIVSLSTTVQTRSTDIYPALTINEVPEPLVSETTLDTIQLTLAGLGQIPGPGEVADVIDTLISLARGDYIGAGAGVLSVIPVIGNAAGAAKIARKLEKLTDAADNANNARKVRNGHLANNTHPKTGVPFDSKGFPDFSNHLYKGGKNDVIIKPTKDRLKDEAVANKAAGYKKTPKGFTWHHHQQRGRMQLIDQNIHKKTGHTGGFKLW